MEVWRVNTKHQSFARELVPIHWEKIGGRGLVAQVLLDEVDPKCAPLGPGNKLIFAPGLLVGHMLSSCDRISIGALSPLTKGIKESNAGGSTGLHITHLGIKVLIIEDKPNNNNSDWWLLYIDPKGARFEPAGYLKGAGVYQTAALLLDRYGPKVAISMIGPGGEALYASAGIQNLDKDRSPTRIAARGGLGAVMGSKQLKAIVIDARDGETPPIIDIEAFRKAQREFNSGLMSHAQTKVYAEYGTAAMTRMSNGFGGLPTLNFSLGQFEHADEISGEHMRQLLLDRGGESDTTHACMAGCTIRCSNVFGGKDGEKIVSPLEYETIGLLGSNLGISNLDTIAMMNKEINDIGLDSIEVGAALGVAAEAGLMAFGDGKRALSLIDEVRNGTELGQILGNGAVKTGSHFGVKRVPAVKGQAMSAYEPRAIKGTGVTYATSPQGADHTAGLTIRAKIDHLDPKGQVDLSKQTQINMAGYDSLGACVFAGFGFAAAPGTIRDLLNARYAWDVDQDVLQILGRETLRLEREFNKQAGFTKSDDRLPEWMTVEALPPHNSVFDVANEELDNLFDWV